MLFSLLILSLKFYHYLCNQIANKSSGKQEADATISFEDEEGKLFAKLRNYIFT